MKRSSQDPREVIRFRALELSKAGWQQKLIATALGVNRVTVCNWLRRARAEGAEALRAKKAPGRQPFLSKEEFDKLDVLLAKGAEEHGFEGDRWTAPRVAEVIERAFGVRYSDGHTCKVLKKIGWSRQKPTRRSTRRDDDAVETWRSARWDELKKKRRTKVAK
jgi:transposase